MRFPGFICSFGRLATLCCVGSCLSVSTLCLRPARADNPPAPDAVGAIEGDAISVQGPMSVDTANGQIKTILRSGSDVRVKSGTAHIELIEGGNISICGPSHFSVLKSGNALTIALDIGTIHARIEGQVTLTVYTPQIQAHTISIGNGPEDALVGLDASGTMCIRPSQGAVRIEQQLTGQSLLIPQNGDVSLVNGQLETLRTTAGQCVCELQLSDKSGISTQVSGIATTNEPAKQNVAAPKPPDPPQFDPPTAPKEEPVYQVFMPPLRYDANTKTQPEYDPNLIILVRRARVRPTLIFQGKVEGDPVVAQENPALSGPGMQRNMAEKKATEDSAWTRVRTFFHKLWAPSS